MVEVRAVRPDEWKSLKSVRLRALRDSPDAFCTTYVEAAAYGDEVWIDRAGAESNSMSFVAIDREEFVGLAVGVMCDDGVLDVVSVWVDPRHRGAGIAARLMSAVEDWGTALGAAAARLDVEAGNERAGEFYAKLGYTSTGVRETYPGRTWLHRVMLRKDLSSR